ncbi:MAG TPA: c-type cytochrome [Bradyrhizobium sp.]
MGLGFCSAMATADAALAQISLPATKSPDGAALFKQQCATCHTTNLSDPLRQGPPLVQIVGRPAGKVEGFHYSPGLALAGFTWDEARLDAWLTDPQAVVPDAIMAYRQAKAETRAAIITYLKGLN